MDQYVFYRNKPKEEIKHSEEDLDESVIDEFLAMSDDEFENCIKHTFDEDDLNYIAHYGVKGMKWGVINEDDPTGGGGIKAKISNLKDRLANVVQKLTGKTVRTDNGSDKFDPNGKTITEDKLTEDKLVEDKLTEDKLVEDKLVEEKLTEDKLKEDKLNKQKEGAPTAKQLQDTTNSIAKEKVSPGMKEDNSDMSDLDKKEKADQAKAMTDKVKSDEAKSIADKAKAKAEAEAQKTIKTAVASGPKKSKTNLEKANEAKELEKEEYTKIKSSYLNDSDAKFAKSLTEKFKANNPDFGKGYDMEPIYKTMENFNFRIDSRKLENGTHDYNELMKRAEEVYEKQLNGLMNTIKLQAHFKTVSNPKKDPKIKHSELVENAKNSLKHWGILGMKWGVRRYQNADGTLTEEGKLHYGKNKLSPEEIRKIHLQEDKLESDIIKETGQGINTIKGMIPDKKGKNVNKYKTTYKKTKYSKLSDQELNSRINRLRKEEEYANLVGDNKYVKSGAEKTREALQTVGSLLALGGTVVAIGAKVRQMKETR